jgi:hypothetical protein
MTDKKTTTAKRKRSIPKARILVEVELLINEYKLDASSDGIGQLINAIEKSIVDEQVAALA